MRERERERGTGEVGSKTEEEVRGSCRQLQKGWGLENEMSWTHTDEEEDTERGEGGKEEEGEEKRKVVVMVVEYSCSTS